DALDKGSMLKLLPTQNRIIGYTTRNSRGVPANFKNYFIIEFDHAFANPQLFNGKALATGVSELAADHVLAAVDFKTRKGEQQGQKAWNQALGRVEIEGGSEEQQRTFYSCLYRALLFPRKFYELDASGQPVHYSPFNGEIRPGYLYTDTGFWDTFRALF
nr:hypothetical protein [Tanacetum cinerariifolium]